MGFEFEKRKQGVGTDLDWALLRTPIAAYMTCGSDRWHDVEALRVSPEDLSQGELKRSIDKLEWKIGMEKDGIHFHERRLADPAWQFREDHSREGIEIHKNKLDKLQKELDHYNSFKR